MAHSSSATQPNRHPNLAPRLIHAVFVLAGVMTTLLGPMLPVLSARWALNDSQAGYFFTAQFTGSMLGVALSGVVVQRRGYRAAFVAGLVALAAGAAFLSFAPWVGAIASVFAYGIGVGLTIPTGNFLIAEWNPDHRAAALNWLNLSWGVGAAGCPFAVLALAPSNRTGWFLAGMAVALSLLALLLAASPVPWPDASRAELKTQIPSKVWLNPLTFTFAALFFFYVGTENSIGGWIASYTQRLHIGPGSAWALAPSFFWVSLLAGRAAAPGLLSRMGEKNVARAGLLTAACGVALLLAAHSTAALLTGVIVAGLGLASVFPITISLVSLNFAKAAPAVGSSMFALAGLGGATLPWSVGALSLRFGALKAGLYIPFGGCLTMLILYLFIGRSPADDSSAGSTP